MLINVKNIPVTGEHYERLIDIQLDGFVLLKPVYFSCDIYKMINDVRVKGSISTQIESNCDRCMDTFALDINGDFEIYYRPKPHQRLKDREDMSPEELGILYYQNDTIDLHSTIKDSIQLEIPMKLLCEDNCLGLCTQCGTNLNKVKCQCQKEETPVSSNPFAEFFNQRKTE